VSPKLTAKVAREAQAHCPSASCGARDKADITTSPGTRSRSRTTSPASVPLATRQSCFTLPREAGRRPQAAAGRHRPTSPPTTPRRASKVAKRGASSAFKGPRLRPMTTTVRLVALVGCVPPPPHAATSVRRGHLQTTSTGFSRRPAQTTHTPSSTSSRITA
jgi:hypothetical protein